MGDDPTQAVFEAIDEGDVDLVTEVCEAPSCEPAPEAPDVTEAVLAPF